MQLADVLMTCLKISKTIVLDKIRSSKQICLQLDEYSDIGKNAQPLDIVRFVNENDI